MQRAREGRAAVADTRPGQAAPRGERRGAGRGSRPGFVVRDSAWEGQRLGRGRNGGPGLAAPGSVLLAMGAAERPPG